MDNSFMKDIVSLALNAQDAQNSVSESSNSEPISGITERDGYVGEMVKASLSIFESRKPSDYGKEFPKDYMVILNSLKVLVAGTDMEIIVQAIPLESIQELITYVENQLDLDLKNIEAYFGSDNKIHMEQDSNYGRVEIIAGVDVYKPIPENDVLQLPVK